MEFTNLTDDELLRRLDTMKLSPLELELRHRLERAQNEIDRLADDIGALGGDAL